MSSRKQPRSEEEPSEASATKVGGAQRRKKLVDEVEEDKDDRLVFEDDIGDEFESEEEIDDEEEEESDSEDKDMDAVGQQEKENQIPEVIREKVKVYRPGVDMLEDDEELDYDPGAYEMFHQATSDWPCLSIDVIRDKLGDNRSKYPMTAYLVAGTQADKEESNRINVMKLSNLTRTERADDSDQSESEDEGADDDPRFDFKMIPHLGCINRIRVMPQGPIVSTWSDADGGVVRMYSIAKELTSLDTPTTLCDYEPKPLCIFGGHLGEEGFAMAFNPHNDCIGQFLSGDCRGTVALWRPKESGWTTELLSRALHQGSVEDIAWKASGDMCQYVWASCSADQNVSVWDVREQASKPQMSIHAHDADVNVISWNPNVSELLLTGSDDGSFKIFDIRNPDVPMAHFQWHKEPITSVDWHPTDETTLAVSSADGCITLWDVAVEDDMDGAVPDGADHFPPQLLFLHQGQKDPKEIRWHPQIPGLLLSTGSNGFNVFKACNM